MKLGRCDFVLFFGFDQDVSGHIDRIPDDIAEMIAAELSKKLADVPLLKIDAKNSFLSSSYTIAMPLSVFKSR